MGVERHPINMLLTCEQRAVKLKTVRVQIKEKTRVANADAAAKVFQDILKMGDEIDRGQEYIWVMGLDSRMTVMFVELVALGSANAALIGPREVYRRAVIGNAVSIILAHNHPSNEVDPSDADITLTTKMKNASEISGIKPNAHLIITEVEHFSMRNHALI